MHVTDDGESTLMVGSDSDETYAKVEPVLKTMAGYIFHMGGIGAGHAMKTLNNYIMASSLTALSDSLVTGQKFGLDPQKMIDVLNVGTGKDGEMQCPPLYIFILLSANHAYRSLLSNPGHHQEGWPYQAIQLRLRLGITGQRSGYHSRLYAA